MKTTKTDRPFWRQGDIFFVRLEDNFNLNEGKSIKNGIIARGETTNHAHRVAASSLVAGAVLYALGREMYLRTQEAGATIVHEEHKPVELPSGVYAVVNQQEFDGLRWRQILD